MGCGWGRLLLKGPAENWQVGNEKVRVEKTDRTEDVMLPGALVGGLQV